MKTQIRLDEAKVQETAKRLRNIADGAGLRLDEGESVFFARQLEHIIAQEFDIEYAELRAQAVIPITMEAGPADQTVTYREYDRVGLAKLISDYSQDLPRVDITGKEVTAKVRTIGAMYGYNYDEVLASAKTGRDLEGRRAEMAREAILRKENYLLLFGDATSGLSSFLQFANVSTYTPAAVGVALCCHRCSGGPGAGLVVARTARRGRASGGAPDVVPGPAVFPVAVAGRQPPGVRMEWREAGHLSDLRHADRRGHAGADYE